MDDNEEVDVELTKIEIQGKQGNPSTFKYYHHMWSDPTKADTDGDGLNDNDDSTKLRQYFSGVLEMEYDGDIIDSKVNYSFCLNDFFKESNIYNSDLSTFSTLMSATIYYGDYLHINGEPKSAFYLLKYHGFEDVKRYEINEGANEFSIDAYSDNHLSEICIGHQEVTYKGKTKDIVAVVVRGTNGTIEEWSSNFDIGSTQELSSYHMWNDSWRTDTSSFDYTLNYFLENDVDELNAFADWKTEDNHKGFDIATNRILKYVHCYVDKYVDENTVSYWITGHSRGAAIANLLSAYLIDDGNEVFSYTFASPNTTTNSQWNDARYNSIFNIVNDDDFVPMLPMDDWGFYKYGVVRNKSISTSFAEEWHSLTDLDYNYDSTICNTITRMSEISNGRNLCYEEDSYSYVQFTNENAIMNSVPKNSLPYFSYEVFGFFPDGTIKYKLNQPPICYMQYLAAVMAKEDGANPVFIKQVTSNKYGEATRSLIAAKLAGINHPHYMHSYYILSKELS